MTQPTWQQLAQEAYDVQNACNLSGVVHGFSRAITQVRALLEAAGPYSTSDVNEHPVCLLWADKIAHLTGLQQDTIPLTKAYAWVFEQGVQR